ncbi:hypothetical protein, variant [Allomyces macrogynus ATCC 38327]|uniref:Cyclic nucleotide-binding domain-containing protein n=1 Tax=Allomyces macrogynus (strain ATCC 38327) TaxID=578462 RepID=A0A0L0SCQ2_ALLM3|nr:hypothetical protein, variant [Allomyces macrogynus ATCC 38327]|eukprot:KNE60204.1 hypothetical protein, variant [Allomyces macrogynus ATCC 38327]
MADMNYPRPERTAAPGNDPARTFAASPRTRRPSLPARPHVAMGFIQPVARPLGATDGPAQSSTDSVEGPFLSTTDLPGSLSGSTSGLGLGIPKAPVNIVPRRRSPLSATPLSMVDGPSNQGRPRSPSPLRASSSALSSRVAGSVDFGSRVGANPSGSASHVAASPSGSVLHGLNGGMGTGSSDFVARNVQMPVSRRNSAASLDDSNRGTQRPRAASSPLALLAFSAALASSSAPRPADPRPIPDPQPDAAHKTTPDIPFPSDMPAPRGPPVPVGPKELDTLQEVEEHDANPLALGQVSASAVGLLSASNGPPPSPSPQSPEPEIDQDAASFDAMIPADPFARSSFSEDGSNPFIKPAWVIRIEAWLCPRLAPVKAYLDYVAQTPEARFWLAWDVLGRIVHVIMFCLIPVVASFPCDFALDFMHSFIALDVMVIFMVLFDLVRPRTNEYGQVETRWREKRRIFFRRPTNWIKVFNAIPFDWYIISTLDKLGNATCSHPHYVYSDKTVVGAPLAHVPDGVEFLGKRFMYNAHEIPAEITFYAAARLFRLLPVVQTLFWFTELKLPLVSKPVGRLIKTLVYSFLLTQLNACFFWMLDTYIDDEDRYIQKILKDPSGIPTNFTYRFARNFAAAQKANFFLPRDGEVTAEVIFQIAEMLVSCLCYGSLFGNMAAIAKSFDTGAVQEKAVKLRLYRKDYLRNFMIARKFSPGLQAKVLNHEAFSWAHKQGYEVDELFDDLPGPLRLEVYSHLYFDLISRVSLFKNVDERFKVAVAERIITITVPNGFYACKAGDVGEELFLIQSGSVAVMPADESKVFATLTAGVCFGEIALLESASCWRPSPHSLTRRARPPAKPRPTRRSAFCAKRTLTTSFCRTRPWPKPCARSSRHTRPTTKNARPSKRPLPPHKQPPRPLPRPLPPMPTRRCGPLAAVLGPGSAGPGASSTHTGPGLAAATGSRVCPRSCRSSACTRPRRAIRRIGDPQWRRRPLRRCAPWQIGSSRPRRQCAAIRRCRRVTGRRTGRSRARPAAVARVRRQRCRVGPSRLPRRRR